ncbi:CRE-DYC-1 protein [Aphelenchoides besseyi]|nr:CRE-DYC-1 protein [Aphelenchoides besseyi]
MPSKQKHGNYDLIADDLYDCRIPLHNELAYQHGIHFEAKYIGSMEIPRPGTRIEIVAAMRRVRYEFKARGIKKRSVEITVSVDGVKVVLQRKKKQQKDAAWDEGKLLVMFHPIYRIFYVSHDSQDLQIFSYIARDGASNTFKCNVFKCSKKSQAMRVVRTIGQAFEVCHKVAQEQMAEKAEEGESSSVSRGRSKRVSTSAISEEDDQQLEEEEREERLAAIKAAASATSGNGSGSVPNAGGTSLGSRGSSPAQPPPGGIPPTRHSTIYVPRKLSSDLSSQGTAIENVVAENAHLAANSAYPQPSVPQQQQPAVGSSNTLPHAHTFNTQLSMGPTFPSLQSLDAQHAAGYPFIPLSSLMPSAFGLSSPVVVSPYATLQLPAALAAQSQTAGPSQTSPTSLDTAAQLTRTLDQYNQQLIRQQLDQAQQSAQVASCQVQLLRDQLTSETTARIEAQSRTHQLLNSNRELLEQIQALVSRLQNLETKITHDIHSPYAAAHQQPSTSGIQPSTSTANYSATLPSFSNVLTSAAQPSTQKPTDTSAVNTQQPYQAHALADLRSGSLPPAADNSDSSSKKRRAVDDQGARTEPDTEDTTDYSSSDQYEPGHRKSNVPSSDFPHYNILLSNPNIIHNLSSFFQTDPAKSSGPTSSSALTTVQPAAMPIHHSHQPSASTANPTIPRHHPPVQHHHTHPKLHVQQPSTAGHSQHNTEGGTPISDSTTRQSSPKRTLRRFSLQSQRLLDETEGTPPHGKKAKATGVFKGGQEFSRLSFMPSLNQASSGKRESITAHTSEGNEEGREGGRRKSRDDNLGVAPAGRRKSTAVASKAGTFAALSSVTPAIAPSLHSQPSTSSQHPSQPSPSHGSKFDFSPSRIGGNLMNKLTGSGGQSSQHHYQPPQQSTSQQFRPASSSVSTAMYPPIKRINLATSIPAINKKKSVFGALAVDIDERGEIGGNTKSQTANPLRPEMTAIGPLTLTPIASHKQLKPLDSAANYLNNNGGVVNTSRAPDRDSVKGRTLQALEDKQFDSNVLARLIKRDNEGNLPNGLP